MLLYFGSIAMQIMAIGILIMSKKIFEVSNNKIKGAVIFGILLCFFSQLATIFFLKGGISKYNPENMGLIFSRFLLFIVVISGLIAVFGMIAGFVKSKVFYFLCPFGISSFFFALSTRLEQGKMQTVDEFYGNILYSFIFNVVVGVLMLIISFTWSQINIKKGKVIQYG